MGTCIKDVVDQFENVGRFAGRASDHSVCVTMGKHQRRKNMAVAGRHAVAVTGEEGREALEAALRIVAAIEAAHRVMRASDESARA